MRHITFLSVLPLVMSLFAACGGDEWIPVVQDMHVSQQPMHFPFLHWLKLDKSAQVKFTMKNTSGDLIKVALFPHEDVKSGKAPLEKQEDSAWRLYDFRPSPEYDYTEKVDSGEYRFAISCIKPGTTSCELSMSYSHSDD